MKAVICTKYGPPETLQLKDNEALVQVRAAAVNYSSVALVEGKPFLICLLGEGLLQPKYRIPGCEIAGQVEALGKNARQFKVVDDVFGDLSECGRGGFAE